MTSLSPVSATSSDNILVMTRMFDAPRPLLFRMWTEPEHLARWWGCAGATVTTFTRDLRPGGSYRVVMTLDDGSIHIVRGVYRDIAPPERLVFTWAWEDGNGSPGHQTVVTVTLREVGAQTELTLQHAVFDSPATCDLHRSGWTASFERLQAFLSTTR